MVLRQGSQRDSLVPWNVPIYSGDRLAGPFIFKSERPIYLRIRMADLVIETD